MTENGGHFTDQEFELLGATVQKLEITKGSIVRLKIPTVGNRWSMPRIHKLAAMVRKNGGELAVVRDDGTILELS